MTSTPTTTELAFQSISLARRANRDETGRIKNQSLDRRLVARERELAIKLLGMAPEASAEKYAATTGELRRWAIER